MSEAPGREPSEGLDSVVQLYQEIEHTADRSFHVGGRTLAELFTNAALALTAVQAATVVEGSRTAREVEVTGVDRETLLVNWLNEILYLQEKHREIYARFAFLAISERYLHARMEGSPLVTARTLVKAVTLPTCGAIMNAQ